MDTAYVFNAYYKFYIFLHTDRDRSRDWQWREERRGRGRGSRWGREGSRWNNLQSVKEEVEEADGEENMEHNSRLYSSLTDPQDVPRKGYFFEVLDTVAVETSLVIYIPYLHIF